MSRFFNNVFSPRSNATKTDDLFADWDLLSFELLLEHFDVKNQAIERGENNNPSTFATTPDEFHANLSLRYQQLIASRTKEISSRIEGLESRAERALEDINFLNDEKTVLKDKLDQDLESFGPVITEVNSSVRSLKNEVNTFKEKNKLTRDANYPESKLWYYFVILGLLGIESIINGSLFASGSAQGIFGGWSIAVLISAVNVIFGFMVGAYWGKQAWSIHIPMKFIGLIGLSVWASFTVAFNLAVGHIRSVYEESANIVNLGEASIISSQGFDPWRDGFINFLANPIGLENFLSWVLVFVGILFAIIALFDGLKIDDKYPGYGPIVKKLKAAQEELHYEVDELKNSSSNYADEYLERGDTERRRLNQEAIALRENHDFTKERVKQEYPKYCSYYAENFKNLINAYRNYNMEARFDEPPEYFSKEPSFDWDTNNRDEQLDKLSNKIDEIRDKAMQEAERWAATRQELESIKKEFLEKTRQYDSIS